MNSPVLDLVSHNLLPAAADAQLQHLDNNQQMELYALLTELKSSVRRIENEFIFMSLKLGKMHEILGDQIFEFVQQHLGMQRYQVQRLLLNNKALTTHLADEEGRVNIAVSSKFTQSALRLFAPITDTGVIEEIRGLAAKGEKINDKVIERVVQAHQSDQDARVALAETEAERATKALQEATERFEVATLRLQNQVTASAEELRKAKEHRQAMELEMETLRKQATIVTEKPVPTIPEGYKSIEAAIDDAKSRLEQAEQRERTIKEANERLIAEQAELQASVTQLHTSSAEYQELRSMADRFLTQYPQAKLQAIAGASAEQRAAVAGMADAMIELGTQLRNAVAKAA